MHAGITLISSFVLNKVATAYATGDNRIARNLE
jgi:hypothetical protein